MFDYSVMSSETVPIGSVKGFVVRKMTEARREAILAAAKAVFEEVGFDQATMAEICAREGGSKATVYRYFKSKDELFHELLRRSASDHIGAVFSMLEHLAPSPEADASRAMALLNPEHDVAVTLQAFGEQVLKIFHTPQRIAARRMVIAAAAGSDAGKLFFENGPKKALQRVASYFDSVMQTGYLRQADAKLAAAQFRALVEAEVEEAAMLNASPPLSDEEIQDYVARAVEVFMRAYGPEKPTTA